MVCRLHSIDDAIDVRRRFLMGCTDAEGNYFERAYEETFMRLLYGAMLIKCRSEQSALLVRCKRLFPSCFLFTFAHFETCSSGYA